VVFPDERLRVVADSVMDVRVLRMYLAFTVAVAVGYPIAPQSAWKGELCFDLFGAVSVAAIVYGIVRNRPADRRPWLLFALGQGLFIVGDVIFSLYDVVFHESPFPSAADGFYLAAYPALAGGLVVLVRRRRPGQDWAALLDAAIVTVGLGSLSWAMLMAPYTRDPSLSRPELVISLAYPLADVLLLAVAVRLLFGGGRRSASLLLVGFSLASLLITDAVYGWLSLHGHYASGDSIDVGWIVSYALFGLAALHPSMGEVSARLGETARRFPVWRLVLLAAALATAPVALAVKSARLALDRGMLAGSALVLIVLAVLRLAHVIRDRERSIGRESVLRRAASALVRAADSDAIAATAVQSAAALAEPDGALALLALGPMEQLTIVAAAGAESDLVGQRLRIPTDLWPVLAHAAAVDLPAPLLRNGGAASTATKLCPLTVGGRVSGALVLQIPGRRSPRNVDALEALAAQVMLALESRQLAEQVFRRRGEQRFRSLVQNSTDLIIVVDPDLTIRYLTPSVEPVLGYAESSCLGRSLSEFSPDEEASMLHSLVAAATGPSGIARRELRLRRHDGSQSSFDMTACNLLADTTVAGIVITARDVTAHRALEAQLRRKAFEDGLTGLANGELFRDRLRHALVRQSGPASPAVLVIDMDDLTDVNDSLGHAAGDAVLVEAARRIRSVLRAGDTSARLGGDEFAVMLDDLRDPAEAGDAAERINAALGRPFTIAGTEIRCSASIGITIAVRGRTDPEPLIQQADLAVHKAKRDGKARSVVFDPAMEEGVVDRLHQVGDLRRALDRGEILVHYQPIVELGTDAIVGVEALARWQRPGRGLLPPTDFIPLAEETGLIVPLGRFVLEEACRQARIWQGEQDGGRRLWVSVNLSVHQLQPSVLTDVAGALALAGLDPSDLVLEVTESVVSSDAAAMIAVLEQLKQLGVQLAIDDFGTGYSALSYLHRLPVDILKIDREFVAGLGGDAAHGEIIEAVIQLARTSGLQVVAEGIEQPGQAETLRALDCPLGQGYLYSPPLDSRQIGNLLAQQRRLDDEAA
jgi:diguanylate cyclase (GGDEF)-like protein/PAS domain S-box-containing protein